MKIRHGIAPEHRSQVAVLYWGAFGAKLGRVMGPQPKALVFINRVLDSNHGISAVSDNGQVLGVTGFKTHQGALVGGTFKDMVAVYGRLGALGRSALLSLLERDLENERFLMDGIFVASEARRQGVGTALLQALFDLAYVRGYKEIRLDVIDTNPRARALYQRMGFAEVQTDHLGPLSWIYGFRSATKMVRPLP